MKHVQWLNAIFVNLEKTNCTISNEKSQFYISELKIVDFVCDSNDRFFEIAKIIKIFKWSSCRDVSKIRTFIDVYVYYRIWIINFIIIVFFTYCLLKNEEFFVWTEKQKNVINILKLVLTIASRLKLLNYSLFTNEIILTVNFNLKRWDVILSQINSETSKNHFFRYKSNLWTMFELKYNVMKRECRELLKILKKIVFNYIECDLLLKSTSILWLLSSIVLLLIFLKF